MTIGIRVDLYTFFIFPLPIIYDKKGNLSAAKWLGSTVT